jgi:H+/gluconate symporter-like permease
LSKLTTLIFIFVSPTLAGILVIGVLAADMSLSKAMPIVIAAAIGVLAAIPVSYFIAQAIKRETQRTNERAHDPAA